MTKAKSFYLYVLRCADRTLYTGIARDVRRRVREHNTSPRGAKYTKGRRPVVLVFTEKFRNHSAAAKAEARLKKLSRSEKLSYLHRYA